MATNDNEDQFFAPTDLGNALREMDDAIPRETVMSDDESMVVMTPERLAEIEHDTIRIAEPSDPSIISFNFVDAEPNEVMRWGADGRIWWRGREVETDDELRDAIRDIHKWILNAKEGQ